MNVSIIGCVVNGPGEALASNLGLAGANKMSGFYQDGERIEWLDNQQLVDQLESRIRQYASMRVESQKIPVKVE